MYDGLSKNDLRIILAHSNYLYILSTGSVINDGTLLGCLSGADKFLGWVEELSAEPDSSQRRDDGEGEGTRDE